MGTFLCKAERDTLAETEELYSLICFICERVEKRSMPLYRIFSEYLSEKRHPFIENTLKDKRGTYGEKMLFMISSVCSEKTSKELEAFALTLGTLDRIPQTEALKKAKITMEKELSGKRTEYRSKSRLYRYLSLLISCVIAVLLY